MANKNETLKKYETTVRSRVECEERAFHIVNKLIDGKVDGPYLIKCGQMMSREHYSDVVEERAISYLCGYPLCDNALTNIPKKQYHISTSTNKVYDISERKNFCSNRCLKASKHFSNQIPESPLWTRAKEAPVDIKLLSHTDTRGMVGSEVVGTLPQKLLETEVKKLAELDLRSSPTRREIQLSEKQKKQTTAVKKTSHAVKQVENSDESVKERQDEGCVRSSEYIVHEVGDEKQKESENTFESEKCMKNNETNSLNISLNRNTNAVKSSDKQEYFQSKQEETFVKSGNTVSTNADYKKLCETSLDVETSKSLNNSNVEKVNVSEERSEQATKMDYLKKLLSKRKDVLSGMIDVMTVEPECVVQPTQRTLPAFLNPDVVASCEDTEKSICGQPSPSDSLLKTSANHFILNQNFSSETSDVRLSKRSGKSSISKKKSSLKSPLDRLGANIKTWVTKETMAYIHSSLGSSSEGSLSFSDPKIQRGYASLCQRLDAQQKDFEDLIDDTEDGLGKRSRSLKSIPDYNLLMEETAKVPLKVAEFKTTKKSKAANEKGESEVTDVVYIPTVDAYDQQQIRIKIVLDRLDKFLPDLLAPLHLSVQDVSSLIRELVYTFRFDKDNIVFKPSEWTLVAIFILKMLGKKNKSIAAAFTVESAMRHFTILLNGIGSSVADLDLIIDRILVSGHGRGRE